MISLAAVEARLRAHDLLLEGAPGATAEAIHTRDITADSRQVRPGSLFCAIRGTEVDGHRFVSAAAAAGAAAALVEQRQEGVALPQLVVAGGRAAAAHAAAVVLGEPWREMLLLAVTGTNGKTTTAAILRHLLASRGPASSVGTLGAIGPDGETLPGTAGLTTPGPVEIARVLGRLAGAGARAVAMEASSHALDQDRLAALSFGAVLFTNLTRDHLDYHPSMEEYRAAKLRLLDLVARDGTVVVNADDGAWDGIQPPPGGRLVTFGSAAGALIAARAVARAQDGTRFRLMTPDGPATVRLPLAGDFNLANALGASAVLWSLGWPVHEIAEGLSTLPQVPGRLERVPGPGGIAVYVDYAHTPDALRRALQALRPFTRGRLIVVFGAGGDRDGGKRPEMGEAAAAEADFSVVTSDNPRTEPPEAIIGQIEAGMGAAPRERIADRHEAIEHALQISRAGDVVLLAGKGHESYQIRGERSYPFDERQIVRDYLQAARSSR